MLGTLASAFAGPAAEPGELSVLLGIPPLPILDLYPLLVEATVETARGKAGVATLKLDSRRELMGRWTVQDRPGLEEGARVQLLAHFGPRTEEVLRGYIAKIQASYPADPGSAQVTVQIQDESLALDREHRREVWGRDLPLPEAVIVASVVTRHPPLIPELRGTGLAAVTLAQDGTDAAFLRARAEANGFDLIFDGGRVYFGAPRLADPPQAPILVYAGRQTNCLAFDLEIDGEAADVVVLEIAPEDGGDPRTRRFVPDNTVLGLARADAAALGLAPLEERMSGEGGASDADLEAKAQARANALSFRITASGELDGSLYGHVLKPGLPVLVDGIGDRFSGLWLVDEVRHGFTAEGYRQGFKLARNGIGAKPGDFAAGALGGLL